MLLGVAVNTAAAVTARLLPSSRLFLRHWASSASLSSSACILRSVLAGRQLLAGLVAGDAAAAQTQPADSNKPTTLLPGWAAGVMTGDTQQPPGQQPNSQQPGQQPQPQQPVQPQRQWTQQQEHFMTLAFEQARIALKVREVPIGCVVVRDGRVIGSGYNMTNHTRNATRHAELEAVDRILADHRGDAAQAGFNRCELYVTIEPCIMCAGALSLLGFRHVYYGAGNDKFGGCGSIMQVHDTGCGCCGGSADSAAHGQPFKAHGGMFADEAIELLQQFYIAGNPAAPKPKRPVLEVPPWEQEQEQQPQEQQQEAEQPEELQARQAFAGSL